MNNEYEKKIFVWKCPNCGTEIAAEIKENTGKNVCRLCGASQVFRHIGRKHDRVDIYSPVY